MTQVPHVSFLDEIEDTRFKKYFKHNSDLEPSTTYSIESIDTLSPRTWMIIVAPVGVDLHAAFPVGRYVVVQGVINSVGGIKPKFLNGGFEVIEHISGDTRRVKVEVLKEFTTDSKVLTTTLSPSAWLLEPSAVESWKVGGAKLENDTLEFSVTDLPGNYQKSIKIRLTINDRQFFSQDLTFEL